DHLVLHSFPTRRSSDLVPKGKVIAIGGPPVPAITNYTNCFLKAAKTDGLSIVGKQYNVKDTAATAQPIVQDLLTKHPDVNAIWRSEEHTSELQSLAYLV